MKQRIFTVDELMDMDKLGLFGDRPFELIDGIIYEKDLPKPKQAYLTNTLSATFVLTFAERACTRVKSPIILPDNTWLTFPDLALVKLGDYSARHPVPEDIFLLIEVSSTTLKNDLGIKLDKYAEAGICEYWIADLSTEEWIIHRDVAPGRYRSITRLSFSESIAPQAFPNDVQVWLE